MAQILLMIALSVVVLLLIATVAFSLYVGWKFLHPPRKPVDMLPEHYGIQEYESVRFPSREQGIMLSGWYFEAEANGITSKGATIIFSHGYTQNRQEPHLPALALAQELIADGYNVLMFDFRNAGESGGSRTTIGLLEQRDLLGAIDYVEQREPATEIGCIGFSMGAATSLLVAGKDDRVKAVVADSSFSCLYTYLREKMSTWTSLPRFPFNSIILTLIPLISGANPRQVKPIEAVKQIAPRPILFIHGTADDTIPPYHSKRMYETVLHPHSELWIVEGTGHVRSYAAVPDEYKQRVSRFFDTHLLGNHNENRQTKTPFLL